MPKLWQLLELHGKMLCFLLASTVFEGDYFQVPILSKFHQFV